MAYDESKYDADDPTTWDWGDTPMTSEEQAVMPLRTHPHSVVAGAFGHMVESEMNLEEYIEYIESLGAADYRKYYGYDDPRVGFTILRTAVAQIAQTQLKE